jgi:hypothetical protein
MRLHRHLELLARQGPGDGGDGDDPVGDVTRRELDPQLPRDPRPQVLVELTLGNHEQQELAKAVAAALEVDDEAVDDPWYVLDDRVQLGRAEAYATTVERGVGAPADDVRAPLGDRDPVAVTPDARVVGEVRVAQTGAVVVPSEAHRHRRHRLTHDELALTSQHGSSILVERGDVDTERGTGDLSCVHGDEGGTADEARQDVGATAAGDELDAGLDGVIDPLVALQGSGEPVDEIARMLLRSRSRPERRPRRRPTIRNPALTPK